MNTLLKYITYLLFLFSSLYLNAENINNLPLSQIRDSIDKYYKTFDTLPKGWKQLEREAAFWKRKLDKEGKMVSPKYIYNEAKSFLDKYKNRETILENERWELLGPTISAMNYGNGKVNCIYSVPNNDSILFCGSVNGGIWRSNNAGNNWEVIDQTDFISNGIMDIAISPSNPSVMYATWGVPSGTSMFKSYSLGIMKSINGGDSWELLLNTLDFVDSIQFYEVLVHSDSPDIVIVSTNRGIMKSIDGGNNWKEVMTYYYFRDMKAMPNNSNVIYATSMMPWNVGGAEVFISKDCGETWNSIQKYTDARRIELAVTPQNPNSLYVLTGYYLTSNGIEGLYKFNFNNNQLSIDTLISIEQSKNDTTIKYNDYVRNQSFHNLTIGVSPIDSNVIIIGGVYCGATIDGGKTWRGVSTTHADHHDIKFIDTFIYICQDGGINKIGYNDFINNTNYFSDCSNGLAITQYYRLGANPYTNKLLLGGSQDNGSHLYNSGSWSHINNGDGMECQFHPLQPGMAITTLQRVSYNNEERFPWITTRRYTPFSIDTFLIIGENVYEVAPANKELGTERHIKKLSDFPLGQAIYYESRGLAYSNLDKNYIYASVGEYLHLTKDYGKTWEDVITTTAGISSIYVFDKSPDIFWFTCEGNVKNEKVFEYNNGVIQNISYNLPNIAINSVVQNTKDSSLFIGSDMGVFVLRNGSNEWEMFNEGMPFVSVMELEYTPGTGYLYAATWGRGMWRIRLNECNTTKPELNISVDVSICRSDLPLIMYITNKEEGCKYIWSNGEKGDTIFIKTKGEYFLCKESSEGCCEISEIINVGIKRDLYEREMAPQPLTRNPGCIGDTIRYQISPYVSSNVSTKWRWSNGSTDKIIKITEPMDLYVIIDSSSTFCEDTYFVDSVRFNEPPAVPKLLQIGNIIICENASKDYTIYEWYKNDTLQYRSVEPSYTFIENPGVYKLLVKTKNNCTALSKPLVISSPIDTNSIIAGNIHPNPSADKVIIELFYDANGGYLEDYDAKINRYLYDELNFAELPSGVYYIVVKIKDYQKTFRVVIER